MFIILYCCLLVRVQPLFLAWANLYHTDSLWALFQGSIVEFWLGYPIFYLGTSEISPLNNSFNNIATGISTTNFNICCTELGIFLSLHSILFFPLLFETTEPLIIVYYYDEEYNVFVTTDFFSHN